MRTASLSEIATIEFGFPFKSTAFNVDRRGVPVVRIRDVVRGQSNTYFDGAFDNQYLVDDGDYLIGMDGEFNLGKWRGGRALLNQRVARIGTVTDAVDRGYLSRFLPAALKKIENETPYVTVKHLSAKALRAIAVPLPSIDEQRRIAAILDHAEGLCSKQETADAYSNELSRAVFLEMFGDPVANHRGWPRVRVQDICTLVRGSSPRPQGDPRYFGGPVPRLMISDITRDGKWVIPRTDSLTLEGAKRSRPCMKGTVVMAVSGNIGLVSQLAIDACIHDGFVGYTELKSDVLRPRFLLDTLDVSKRVHETSTAGAIFKNITTTDIKALELIAPPLHLQDDYCRRVEAMEGLCMIRHAQALALERLFASLQSRAFSGQL